MGESGPVRPETGWGFVAQHWKCWPWDRATSGRHARVPWCAPGGFQYFEMPHQHNQSISLQRTHLHYLADLKLSFNLEFKIFSVLKISQLSIPHNDIGLLSASNQEGQRPLVLFRSRTHTSKCMRGVDLESLAVIFPRQLMKVFDFTWSFVLSS